MMIWKKIPSTNNIYEASTDGDIRRIKGVVSFGLQKRNIGGTNLKPKTKSNGYKEVNLLIVSGVSGQSKYVHRLVAEAFIGDIPKGMCVNHKDGNKANNLLSNLEIVTYSENNKHAYRIGLKKSRDLAGEKHPMSKYTDAFVLEVRALHKSGLTPTQISEDKNINRSSLCKMLYRATWTHV